MDHKNFLIFQLSFNTFTMPAGFTGTIVESESKRLSNDKTKPAISANNSLSLKMK